MAGTCSALFDILIIRPDKNAAQSDLGNGRNGLRYVGLYVDCKHWANKLLLTGARKKGQLWYLNPLDSGDNPTANQLLIDNNKQSIPQPSYLDKPTINSIASVYQSKIIKDAMQFHHAAFSNCAKSTLLAAAATKILPLWPLLTQTNIFKYVTET